MLMSVLWGWRSEGETIATASIVWGPSVRMNVMGGVGRVHRSTGACGPSSSTGIDTTY